jgi:hypothetical protein
LKSITLMMDGKDFEVFLNDINEEYRKTKNQKSNLISRKNKKGGSWKNCFKLVILIDIRGLPIKFTNIYGANEKYDGHLAEELGLIKFMDVNDCALFDNHFNKFMRDMCSDSNKENKKRKNQLDQSNFFTKIRKPNNKKLSKDEALVNSRVSALLGLIESGMNAQIAQKCQLFNGKSPKKWPNFKTIEVLLNIAYTLIGIDKQVKKFPEYFENIEGIDDIQDINFDFPKEKVFLIFNFKKVKKKFY